MEERLPKEWMYYQLSVDTLALIAGGALTLAFAPFSYYLFVFFSLGLLLSCWSNATPGRAFWRGWLFGAGFFSTSISWVYYSLYNYGLVPFWLSVLLTCFLVAYCAFFPAMVGYLLNRFFKVDSFYRYILGFPGLWVCAEWVRSTLFSGFPWMLIGYSQVDSPLHGLAPLAGVYGISYLAAVMTGILLYAAIATRLMRTILFSSFILLWISAYGLAHLQWAYPLNTHLTVSLVQGNITADTKWTEAQFQQTLDIYKKLILSQLSRDLIILPESAIPAPSWFVQDYLNELNQAAQRKKSAIVIGIPVENVTNKEYTNSLLVLGEGKGQYDKRHLVPFGEYFPFLEVFRGLLDFLNIPMSSFKEGLHEQPPLLIKGISIAPFICYEIAYGNLVHFSLPEAQALLVISDDSWFGHSNAQAQHLQIMQMRAQETQRSVLSATNDGITAIVNPFGTIVAKTPRFQRAILQGSIDGMYGTTPLMYYGEGCILAIIGLISILGLIFQNMKESGE